MVWIPSRRSGSGLKALPQVQEGSVDSLGGPEGIRKPSQRSGRDREALLMVQDGSGGPLGSPGGVGWPSQRCGRGHEALPKVWEWSGGHSRGTGKGREPFLYRPTDPSLWRGR